MLDGFTVSRESYQQPLDFSPEANVSADPSEVAEGLAETAGIIMVVVKEVVDTFIGTDAQPKTASSESNPQGSWRV